MPNKAKFGFGNSSDVERAIQEGKINARDILFLDENTDKPKIGWVTKSGKAVILTDEKADLSEIEADVEAIELELATKANADEVEALGLEISTKADTTEVEEKISQATTNTIASAKEYANKLVEAAMDEHLTKKYEITDVPEGTLVTYRENEIRVMCPVDTAFVKQNVGAGGNANNYYMTFKTYAPSDDAVGYIEHLGGQSDSEILYDFKTDEFGKRYQPTWLGIAVFDESAGNWNYYGKSSSASKFIGWDYQIDWFNANGVMIASDSIRINLSNEDCHYSNEPYYISSVKKEVETLVEEKIKEVESSYEIVEF